MEKLGRKLSIVIILLALAYFAYSQWGGVAAAIVIFVPMAIMYQLEEMENKIDRLLKGGD